MQINEFQLKLVNDQVQRLVASGNYFGRRLQEAGVTEVLTEDDFLALPFSEKEDLRNCYPLGVSAVDEREIVRIHSSSGTTGTPVIIPYTARALLRGRGNHRGRPNPDHSGLRPLDRGHRIPGGRREARCDGRPHGSRQHGEAAAVHGGPPDDGHWRNVELRLAPCRGGREARHARQNSPHQGSHRLRALGREDARPREVGPWHPGLRHLRPHRGLRPRHRHLLRRRGRHALLGRLHLHIYIEIVDPETGEPLPDGEWGEIVITTLVKEGAPLIRFRTHDLSRIIPGTCPCGCAFPRIGALQGRSDDMVKIHGVNVFPRQIEEILQTFPALSSEYQIRLSRTSRDATPCASTSRRTERRTSSTPRTPSRTRSSGASASPRSSRSSSSACFPEARRRPAASLTSATTSRRQEAAPTLQSSLRLKPLGPPNRPPVDERGGPRRPWKCGC